MIDFAYDPRVKLDRETEAVITARFANMPEKVEGRPPTKREVWARVHHVYHGLLSQEELVEYARCRWAWDYAAWVNFRGWDKHPDWVEGDTVIAEAVPERPMNGDRAPQIVPRLWEIVKKRATA